MPRPPSSSSSSSSSFSSSDEEDEEMSSDHSNRRRPPSSTHSSDTTTTRTHSAPSKSSSASKRRHPDALVADAEASSRQRSSKSQRHVSGGDDDMNTVSTRRSSSKSHHHRVKSSSSSSGSTTSRKRRWLLAGLVLGILLVLIVNTCDAWGMYDLNTNLNAVCDAVDSVRYLLLWLPWYSGVTPSPTPAQTELEHIEQKLPPKKKKGVSRKREEDFACMELDCVKSKCAGLTSSLETSRCKKKCAAERCEARCKDEPKPSYVERELRMEKCIEDCGDGEKCKAKCEEEAKHCKQRCGERAKSFFCVRPLSLLNEGDKDEEWAESIGKSDASLSEVEAALASEEDVI